MSEPKDLLELPKFPTPWGEEEQARQEKLKVEREKLREAYGVHFAPGVYEAKPWAERLARGIAYRAQPLAWLERKYGQEFKQRFDVGLGELWRRTTPWTEIGTIPREADQIIRETEREVKELIRREDVVQLAEAFPDYLLATAFEGKLTGDLSQLYRIFPQLDPGREEYIDITDKERMWFEKVYSDISAKSLDKLLELMPDGIPPFPLQELLGVIPTIQPRFILSTVAFSKDVELIGQALQLAYPPQAEDIEGAIKTSFYNRIIEEMFRLGLEPTDDIEENIRRLQEAKAKEKAKAGVPRVIMTEDGSILLTTEKGDGIYVEGFKIANVDPETRKVIPLTTSEEYLLDNAPIVNPTYRDTLKLLYRTLSPEVRDSFWLIPPTQEAVLAWMRQHIDPKITSDSIDFKSLYGMRLDSDRPMDLITEAQYAFRAGFGDVLRIAGGAARWRGYDGVGHLLYKKADKITPQLPPRPEFDVFDWKHLGNPAYWASRVTRVVPFTLTLLPAAIFGWKIGLAAAAGIAGKFVLGAFATKVLGITFGGVAGGALSRSLESAMEAGGAFDMVLGEGGSLEEADAVATEVFWKAMRLLGVDAAQIAAAFVPISNPTGVLARGIGRGLFVTARVGGRVTIVGLTEAGEEYYQTVIVRQATGEEDPWRFDPEAQEAAALGGIMGIGMGAGGDVLSNTIHKTKASLTPEQQRQFDNDKAQAKKQAEIAGATPEQAEALSEAAALDKLAETEEGAKLLEQVVEVTKEQEFNKIITNPKKRTHKKEIAFLQDNLRVIEGEISVYQSSYNARMKDFDRMKDAAAPFELKEIKETIQTLEKELTDLLAKKKELNEQLKRLGVTEPTPKAEVALEVTEASLEAKYPGLAVQFYGSEEMGFFGEALEESSGKYVARVEGATHQEVENSLARALAEKYPEVTPVTPEPSMLYAKRVSPEGVAALNSFTSSLEGLTGKLQGLDRIRNFMEGYSKLASLGKKFSGRELNSLFGLIVEDWKFRSEEQLYYSKELVDIIESTQKNPTRIGKVETIERFIHEQHERGNILPQVFLGYGMEYDKLKGLNPERVREFVGEELLVVGREATGEPIISTNFGILSKLNEITNKILGDLAAYKGEIGIIAEARVPEVSISTEWDNLSQVERLSRAIAAGIAKTAAKSNWAELTSIQQEKLLGIPFIPKEARAVDSEGLSAEEIMQGKHINKENMKEQLKDAPEGLPEKPVDVESLRRIKEVADEIMRKLLFAADPKNPLSVALVRAAKTQNIRDYVEHLPPDLKKLPQEFLDATFNTPARWSLNFQQPIDASADIDWGRVAGVFRTKVITPGIQAQQAAVLYEEAGSREWKDMVKKSGVAIPGFLGFQAKKQFNEATYKLGTEIGDLEMLISSEAILAREDIAEILKGYPREQQLAMIEYMKGVRELFNKWIGEANLVRVKLGLEPIEFLKNYLPRVVHTNIWGKFFGIASKPEVVADIALTPDLQKPSKPFNPRALARKGGLRHYELEKDVNVLAMDYIGVIAREMFYTPVIQRNKAFVKNLRERNYDTIAGWLEDLTLRGMAGVPDPLTRLRQENVPSLLWSPLVFLRRRLNAAVFGLNIPWNLVVQTSSIHFLWLMIEPRFVGKAFIDYMFNPEVRKEIDTEVPSFIIKQTGKGSVIFQDVAHSVGEYRKAVRSPLETVDDAVTILTRTIERYLQGISARAGWLQGEAMGLKGAELVAYASDIAARTQSEFDLLNLPLAYGAPEIRMLFPFQTFMFTALTRIREHTRIKGLRAGEWATVDMPLDQKLLREMKEVEGKSISINTPAGKVAAQIRMQHILSFIAGMWVANMIGDWLIDREPWEESSFMPMSNMLLGAVNPRNTWYLLMPERWVHDFWTGIDIAFSEGNFEPLVNRFFNRYIMPAGLPISRALIYMIAANQGGYWGIEGKPKDEEKDPLFEVEGFKAEDWKAWFQGVWYTETGREYFERHIEGVEPETRKIILEIKELEDQLGTVVKRKDYTVRDYFRDALEKAREFDDPEWKMIDDVTPYPPLLRFALQSEYALQEYYNLPDNKKIAYRRANPWADGLLIFWERVRSYRSIEGKEEWERLRDEWIPNNPKAHWTGLEKIPEDLIFEMD